MTDLYSPALVREAEVAARRRLGVPSERDAALLARAGVRAAGAARATLVARAANTAARGLERLAARLDRIGGVATPRTASRLARR
jgi:hypothetical protein